MRIQIQKVTLQYRGTVAGNYIYDWDIDGVGDNDDTEDLNNLGGGSYTVSIIDDNGETSCTVR